MAPPSAPPLLLLTIERHAPAFAFQAFLRWDLVVATEVLRAVWQKDHGGTHFTLPSASYQGVPGRLIFPRPGGDALPAGLPADHALENDAAVQDLLRSKGPFPFERSALLFGQSNFLLTRGALNPEDERGAAAGEGPDDEGAPPVAEQGVPIPPLEP